MEYQIRLATAADAKALSEIYTYYTNHTVVTFTTIPPTETEYREKIPRVLRQYPFLVACDQQKILGFAYGERLRPHDAYQWDVELTIYLHPDTPKRQGIGRKLLSVLLALLKAQGYLNAYSVITEGNEPSLALHRAFDFAQVAFFPKMGYKHGRWLGVYWLEKTLGDISGEPQPPTPFEQLPEDKIQELLLG